MKKTCLSILLIFILFYPMHLGAWEGYGSDSGNYIELPDGASIIPGENIEIYDFSDQAYHEVQIVSIKRNGNIEIEVYDYDLEDHRTFVMEDEKEAQESAFPDNRNKVDTI